MPGYAIHPAIRLVLWVVVVLFVQALSGMALVWAFVALPMVGKRALKRGLRLVWRARWLLFSLFIVFAWGVAGAPVWSSVLAPTEEGIAEAVTHLGRLLLVLMAVATFLEYVSDEDLLAATHSVLRPFRRLGLDPDRGVVRLMLVLRAVESLPRPRDWRVLLEAPAHQSAERLEVSAPRFRGVDYAIGFALLLLAGYCVYRYLT